MILSTKSLEKLRLLINEETEYRSGPQLVRFFNALGFEDVYAQGFPSRWMYTDEKLLQINGSPYLDKCIKYVLAPSNFIDNINKLDNHIAAFNKYLTFDRWKIVRKGADITFEKLEKIDIAEPVPNSESQDEDEFLKREFTNVSVSKIGLESAIGNVLDQRIKEIEKCFGAGAHLSVILMAGSTLEGILLGLAFTHPKRFGSATAAPKDSRGKVCELDKWSLSSFIDVAYEIGLLQRDTQKFSHTLRDFRNYIHPFEQMRFRFTPRQHTAKLCLQVLRAAIYEIGENIQSISD